MSGVVRDIAAVLIALVAGAACAPAPHTPEAAVRTVARGSGGTNRAEHLSKPYVVLISFDGFRSDYIDIYKPRNFMRVARDGVRANGLIPVFPSKTFPNHYSIVTGLWPENHGLVGNRFYDPVRRQSYALGNANVVGDSSWYRGEPIWVTAEKQGMVTVSSFWVASEAAIQGVRPTSWKPYSYSDSFPSNTRVDSVLAWLRRPPQQRPHVVTLYLSEVDGAGHDHGPGTPQVAEAVHSVDSALGRLLVGIEQMPIRDSVYVILVSDHGMAAYGLSHGIAIETLIDTADVLIAETGPYVSLHVHGDQARARQIRDRINAQLRHGRAYLRSDIPERYHYRSDRRAGDVLVVMEVPYVLARRSNLPRRAGGNHGWDPAAEVMHGIFLALGPGIRKGATIPAFENVHIQPFMTEVLQLAPPPGVNGSAGWLRRQLMN